MTAPAVPARTGSDAPAAPAMQKLRLPQFLGYASGDAANNLAFSMTTSFLLLYYTDVAGLSLALVGTLFLLVRIWDAASDIVAGRLVDSTMTRWGKFRPFILFGGIPLLLLSVAVFTVPSGFSLQAKIIYAFVTYIVFGFVYSLVNIPYGSLAAAMTQSTTERAKLASFRVIGSNLTILMLAFVVAPQIKGSTNLQQSLTITTLIFVVVGAALYFFTFLTAKEQVLRDVAKVSIRQTLQSLRHNKPLLMLCLSSLMFLSALLSTGTVAAFYTRNVLGDANYFIITSIMQTIGVFAAAFAAPQFVRTMGKKNAYLLGGVIAIVAAVGLFLAPPSVPAVAFACFLVLGVGLGLVNTLMWAFEADTVEYGEWTSGVRTEGITYAAFSFTRKMGQAVGGAAAAFTLGFGGYVAGVHVHQTSSALLSIRIAAGVVPAAFILISIAIMAFYPLTETRFREIVREMAQRRATRAATTATPAPAPQ